MKIVIATDSFKGTLSSADAGQSIRHGALDVWPDANVIVIPIADGGEGTLEAVLAGSGGTTHEVEVPGPLGHPVRARFGLLLDGTAVLEMAASSGLSLVPPDRRDPTRTSTYGTGCQMTAAMDAGATRLLIGIGGSATVDGGCGCAQALGIRFFAADGTELPAGLAGGDLDRVARIDHSARDPRLSTARVEVLSDVDNPLCGPTGAAAIFGPQKGATREQIPQLERNLRHLADLIERDLSIRVHDVPGAGAAGGLGAGLIAFAGARLRSGIDAIIERTRLPDVVQAADLVITGEGRIDAQSMMGKVVSGVARCARRAGVPVIAIAGSAGPGADDCLAILDAFYVVSEPGEPPPSSPAEARDLLARGAAHRLKAWRGGTGFIRA